ncbi:MAG: hypothetical protein HEQ38_17275 [Gemmatimonas sp.]|nr:hypothetical protein [Gemmatimonas sp.]
MTGPSQWIPPAELLNETRAIIGQLARRWPNRLSGVLARTEAAQQDLTAFAYALRDIEPKVLPMIPREYLLGHEFPPGPHELRVEAQRIEARDFPKPTPAPLPPPPIDHGKDVARIAEVNRVLRAELGSYPLVMLAWDHLAGMADGDPEAKAAVAAGRVTPEAIAGAIRAVRPQATGSAT